jgi:hypothetical protein
MSGAESLSLKAIAAPKHIILDQTGVFTGNVFAELLDSWNVKHRFRVA